MKFVALLRGINVGKSVQVSMKELKSTLEQVGLSHVVTYLNSGNVLFNSQKSQPEITRLLEETLEQQYQQKIATLVKTGAEIIQIAQAIPAGWNNDQTQQTYVAYLFKDAADPNIIAELPIKTEYMNIFYAHECLIWNIQRENYHKSQITKIVGHRSYRRMTTRNSNTARKLAELCALQDIEGTP